MRRIFTRKFYREDIGYKIGYIIGFIVRELFRFKERASRLFRKTREKLKGNPKDIQNYSLHVSIHRKLPLLTL